MPPQWSDLEWREVKAGPGARRTWVLYDRRIGKPCDDDYILDWNY